MINSCLFRLINRSIATGKKDAVEHMAAIFIPPPVFCEIFFKNISLFRLIGLLWNFSSNGVYGND